MRTLLTLVAMLALAPAATSARQPLYRRVSIQTEQGTTDVRYRTTQTTAHRIKATKKTQTPNT